MNTFYTGWQNRILCERTAFYAESLTHPLVYQLVSKICNHSGNWINWKKNAFALKNYNGLTLVCSNLCVAIANELFKVKGLTSKRIIDYVLT
jgi:hypothetical protein